MFVADAFERQFPEVHRCLAAIFREHGIPNGVIPGTLQVRCRDYPPVVTARGRFVQYPSGTDCLHGLHRFTRADRQVGPRLPWVGACKRSEAGWDGGNVVPWVDLAIATDEVLRGNPEMGRGELVNRLGRELGLAELIVLPREPYDPIGHADR